MFQHGTIHFAQNIQAHLHDQIRTDPQYVPIECRMMELAEREAIWDNGFAQGVAIGEDMGGLQEFGVAEAANRTLRLVGTEDALAEALLVKSALGHGGDVLAASLRACLGDDLMHCGALLGCVHRHTETKARRIIGHNIDRPHRQVLTRNDAEEVDQRRSALHGESQANIIPMCRIGPPVTIEQKTTWPYAILVGAWPSLYYRDCGDTERYFRQQGGLEYTLGADERDADLLEGEAGGKNGARKNLPMQLDLLRQEGEGCKADTLVETIRDLIQHFSPRVRLLHSE
jgi:hypothetical protein